MVFATFRRTEKGVPTHWLKTIESDQLNYAMRILLISPQFENNFKIVLNR